MKANDFVHGFPLLEYNDSAMPVNNNCTSNNDKDNNKTIILLLRLPINTNTNTNSYSRRRVISSRTSFRLSMITPPLPSDRMMGHMSIDWSLFIVLLRRR